MAELDGYEIKKMDPEIKALWLTALRSGEFPQAIGALKNDKGNCCLGVLCEVAVRNEVIPEVEYSEEWNNFYYVSMAYDCTPPDAVTKWAGLFNNDNPEVIYNGECVTLIDLNDSFKLSFLEIADIIEEQL